MSVAEREPPSAGVGLPAQENSVEAVRGESGGLRLGQSAERLADDYDVLLAYQVFLERNPENSAEMQQKLHRPIRIIAQEFMREGGFHGLIAEPSAGGAKLVHARSRLPLTAEQVAWVAELMDLPRDQIPELEPEDLGRSFVLVHLDAPGPGAPVPTRGTLEGHGWVIARSEVTRIGVFLGDERVCPAALEAPPAEALRRFPHMADVRRRGFRFTAALRARNAGPATLAVAVRTADRSITRKLVPVVLANDAEHDAPAHAPAGADASRSRLTPAELEHRQAALERAGHHPFFLILVQAEGISPAAISHDGAQGIRATLRSLQGQIHPSWRAVVALPEGCDEVRAATAIAGREPCLLARARLWARAGRGPRARPAWPDLPGPRFLMILRAGERLAPEALLELAATSAANPAADFIASEPGEARALGRKHGRSADHADAHADAGLWCADWRLAESAGLLPEIAAVTRETARRALAARARAVAHAPAARCLAAEAPRARGRRPGA